MLTQQNQREIARLVLLGTGGARLVNFQLSGRKRLAWDWAVRKAIDGAKQSSETTDTQSRKTCRWCSGQPERSKEQPRRSSSSTQKIVRHLFAADPPCRDPGKSRKVARGSSPCPPTSRYSRRRSLHHAPPRQCRLRSPVLAPALGLRLQISRCRRRPVAPRKNAR